MRYIATNIKWDISSEDKEENPKKFEENLPSEILAEIENPESKSEQEIEEEILEKITEETGFLVQSFDWEKDKETRYGDVFSSEKTSKTEDLKEKLKQFLLNGSDYTEATINSEYGTDRRFTITLTKTNKNDQTEKAIINLKIHLLETTDLQKFRIIDNRIKMVNFAKGNTGRVRMAPFVSFSIPSTATAEYLIERSEKR